MTLFSEVIYHHHTLQWNNTSSWLSSLKWYVILTLQWSNMLSSPSSNYRKSFIYSVFSPVILFIHFGRGLQGDIPEISIIKPSIHSLSVNLGFSHKFCITGATMISNVFLVANGGLTKKNFTISFIRHHNYRMNRINPLCLVELFQQVLYLVQRRVIIYPRERYRRRQTTSYIQLWSICKI